MTLWQCDRCGKQSDKKLVSVYIYKVLKKQLCTKCIPEFLEWLKPTMTLEATGYFDEQISGGLKLKEEECICKGERLGEYRNPDCKATKHVGE